MSKLHRWRPRRMDTLLVGFACMLALITAMGLQVRPFTYLWVSLYTGFAVAVLAISLTIQLEKKYREEHEAALAAKQDLQRLSSRLVVAQEQERHSGHSGIIPSKGFVLFGDETVLPAVAPEIINATFVGAPA